MKDQELIVSRCVEILESQGYEVDMDLLNELSYNLLHDYKDKVKSKGDHYYKRRSGYRLANNKLNNITPTKAPFDPSHNHTGAKVLSTKKTGKEKLKYLVKGWKEAITGKLD